MADETSVALLRDMRAIVERLERLEVQPRGQWWGVLSAFLALPGLRGFWPMSVFDGSGNAIDVSGHGHTLTYNGNPTYNVTGLAPYLALDGTGDYLSKADDEDLDILGTEAYVGIPGLTLGGWFYSTDTTNSRGAMSKWDSTGPQRSYALLLGGAVEGDPVLFYISDDGTNTDNVVSSVGYSASTWTFIAGRFDDSDTGAEQAVWVNATKTTDTTARAAAFNSTADFLIGGRHGGNDLMTGRASLCFLCAAAVPDNTISLLYQCSRGLFGV